MKNSISIWIWVLIFTQNLQAQKITFFESGIQSAQKDHGNTIEEGVIMEFSTSKVQTFTHNAPSIFEMDIPVNRDGKQLHLKLNKVDIFAEGFQVFSNSKPELALDLDLGIHYHGTIEGEANSLAAISIYQGQISGMMSTSKGVYNLGKLKNEETKHLVYLDKQLEEDNPPPCLMNSGGIAYEPKMLEYSEEDAAEGDCVGIYVEADGTVADARGGVAEAVAYVTAIFNQSFILYANEDICLCLSELFVWESNIVDPYPGGNGLDYLNQFKANTDDINGDLGHLVAMDNQGGLAAQVGGLCNPDVDQRLCFSGLINQDPIDVPTYSFNVYIISHEMGHLMGSAHTQACVWNGDGTAIDGCPGSTEGPCPVPPNPIDGGTIMSYCNSNPVGINFNLGFGEQPGAVLRNTVANATCLGTYCQEVICDATLVQFGYGDDCNDYADDLDPYVISPCVEKVTNLEPYNGNSGASCSAGIICVSSMVNGWEFTMTAAEAIEINQVIASLSYPINISAGGPANENDCLINFPNFPYVITFSVNGALPIHTHTGSIPGSTILVFIDELISIPSGIILGPNDELTVRIDGEATTTDCDLFELSGLSVGGCCSNPCLDNWVDLGPDQSICSGEEVTLNATINTHGTISRSVDSKKDDAEENTADGAINRYSSDLEMVYHEGDIQLVGIRFNQINIPQGALITSASIQFTADEADAESTNLIIHGEDTGNALEYEDEDFNISDRASTGASVAWTPGPWAVGDAGGDQRTPDLLSIVQEIVDKSNWDYGHSMAFMISGSGKRVAESTSGSYEDAPQMTIEYEWNSTGPYTYIWSTGATTESISVNPIGTSVYSVTVTDGNGCTATDEVTISLGESCCNGFDLVVECTGDKAALSIFQNGILLDPTFYAIDWGIGGVVSSPNVNPLTVNNVAGSTYDITISQKEQDLCNWNGVISCDKGKIGISKIHPNPSLTGDQLYLSSTDQRFLDQEVSLLVTNEIGQTVHNQKIRLREKTPLPKLQPGVYLMHILNKRTGEREAISFYVESM